MSDSDLLPHIFTAAELMSVTFPEVTAAELVASGDCSGQCLVAAENSCQCACGGYWHGALANQEVQGGLSHE